MTYYMTPWINEGEGRFWDYEAATGLFDNPAPMIVVEASDVIDALEIVYGICNSYPQEMFVSAQYVDDVAAYRAPGRRSLSVGDVVTFDDPKTGQPVGYAVGMAGWTQIDPGEMRVSS